MAPSDSKLSTDHDIVFVDEVEGFQIEAAQDSGNKRKASYGEESFQLQTVDRMKCNLIPLQRVNFQVSLAQGFADISSTKSIKMSLKSHSKSSSACRSAKTSP